MKEIWNHIEVDNKKVKEFGYLIAIILCIIVPLISGYKNDWTLTALSKLTFISGSIFVLLTSVFTARMYPVYKSWMLLALALGFIMTRVIISIVFLLMITPIGLIRRLKGNNVSDSFKKFKTPPRESYWILRNDEYDPVSTEKQY
jgi:hypothetical protein